jgi:glycerol uptake operon antiterminator
VNRTREILDMFGQSPIIAAVKSDELLDKAVKSDCMVVFILYGTICSIDTIVARVKDAGKKAIVHVDLIDGLGKDPVGVDFIHDHTRADGIISTKQNMARRAKEVGLIAGERSFVVDSMAFGNCKAHLSSGCKPDFLEIMPGLLGDIISELHAFSDVPMIAGGLIRSKEDILQALNHGASAISTTKDVLWSL